MALGFNLLIYKKLFIPENICIHYILTEQINGRNIKW